MCIKQADRETIRKQIAMWRSDQAEEDREGYGKCRNVADGYAAADYAERLLEALEKAESDVATLRECVEWYADEEHYDNDAPGVADNNADPGTDDWWQADVGSRARATLAKLGAR